MAKKTTPYVMHEDKLYVAVDAIMSQMSAVIDGLAMTRFGPTNKWYLPIDDAIVWCQKEILHPLMRQPERDEYLAIIKSLKAAKAETIAKCN